MELSQVRYFLAVASELNFTRAAEQCNVTQPALSRGIKMLEEEFGGALFHRERRYTHLTELGRMVHTYLAGVYENSMSAKQIAEQYTRLKKTPLKLGIMSTISPNEIVELVASGTLAPSRRRAAPLRLRRQIAARAPAVGRAGGGDLCPARDAAGRPRPHRPAVSRADGDGGASRTSACQPGRRSRARDEWRELHPSQQLRVRRLCRRRSSPRMA